MKFFCFFFHFRELELHVNVVKNRKGGYVQLNKRYNFGEILAFIYFSDICSTNHIVPHQCSLEIPLFEVKIFL